MLDWLTHRLGVAGTIVAGVLIGLLYLALVAFLLPHIYN